jgi:hypothetical protein
MEHLFSPCTRLHDLILENLGDVYEIIGNDLERLPELNLDVSTEEFLSANRGFTYADLYAMLKDRDAIAWLTPHAAVVSERARARDYWDCLEEDYAFYFRANGETIVGLARSAEALGQICNVIHRLVLADVSEIYELELRNVGSRGEAFFSAPNLAYLMEQCQSLEVLTLGGLESLDEDHVRVLGDYSRPGLEIELHDCLIIDAAASALVQILGRNQGPTKLAFCNMDFFIVADGLRGNSRLKSLIQHRFYGGEIGNRQVLAIAHALRENKGLIDLDICYEFWMSDEAWCAVCDSLKTHPTLEVLNLCTSITNCETTNAPAATIKTRSQAILDMMKVNKSLHAVDLDSRYREHDLYRRSVPYLETNRLRPRLRAIQKTRPIAYRTKVLGRSLLATRTNANSFWMLLSGNAEVAFPSRTTMIAAATNLPTPATAAATSNAAAVDASSPITGAASTTNVSSLDIVASPKVGQKRKTRP